MMGWPLFSYHPATNRVELFYAPPRQGEGPVMYWYGWTASSMLGAAALGLLATFLPEHVARKNPAGARLDRPGPGDSAAVLFVDAVLDAIAITGAVAESRLRHLLPA